MFPVQHFMRIALKIAEKTEALGDVPIAAVLVHENKIIAAAGNEVEQRQDPTAHAEILTIQAASQYFGTTRLTQSILYVTLEPCPMCAQAISFARIDRVIFGCYDPKGGGIDHGPRIFQQPTCHHRPEVIGGVLEQECAKKLRLFFQNKR